MYWFDVIKSPSPKTVRSLRLHISGKQCSFFKNLSCEKFFKNVLLFFRTFRVPL